jgi:hypothetical protein
LGNLDQVVAALTVDYEKYDLVPFRRAPLHNADAVYYRHEVLRDLKNDAVREPVEELPADCAAGALTARWRANQQFFAPDAAAETDAARHANVTERTLDR